VQETIASVQDASDGLLRCPICSNFCPQHFGPSHGVGMRIDCTGEDATSAFRVEEGTARFNLGLRGIDTVVGKRPDGKPKLAYRPITHHEVGSRRNAREIALRQGLEPASGGAYRSIGGR
jgi:hypothetical protein